MLVLRQIIIKFCRHRQGFSQMMRRVHLDCKSSFMESRSLEFFLREARMQRVEWMVKASKRPLGLSVVFSRKDTTELSQAACGAHRQRMADMRRAGEQRLFCLLSHGL
jgi:hypothetical protein